MNPAIEIDRVSKRYRIGGLHPGYLTFREVVVGTVGRALKGFGHGTNGSQTIWALRDVSFSVGQGDIVGIIGRNGAGKSTLLKILSRVTKPTKGSVALYGRVGSLLEVGTGFHPDLTGRENIFLSGALLGMRRAEIEQKFDEIVAFSELERFVETPVKHYSTGMYVRLAFSVAAHLEPEILMMDEVLAVGDAAFQQKCLDKMHAIRQEGRTVLFVSHDMAAITRLCKRVVLLEGGQIAQDGSPTEVVNHYLKTNWNTGAIREWPIQSEAPGNDIVRLRRVRVHGKAGETISAVNIHEPFGIELTYDVLQGGQVLVPVVELYNQQGTELFSTHDTKPTWRGRARERASYTSTVWIPGNLLAESTLAANVSLMSHTPTTVLHAHETNVVAFQVIDTDVGETARGDYIGPMPGVVRPLLDWTTEVAPPA